MVIETDMQIHIYYTRKIGPIPEKESNLNIFSAQNYLRDIK